MTYKTNKFIIKPRVLEELMYHDMARAAQEVGLGYEYMGRSLLPEADIQVGVHEIKQIPADFKSFIEPHRHDTSQFYGIIGELSIEVTLEGERHEINGPASVFIPPGMLHTFRPLRGSGYILIVLRSGEYK